MALCIWQRAIGSSGTFPLRSPGWLKAMPVGEAKRRGAGRLAGYADIGWSNALGWYEGLRLLAAVAPSGVITGFGFASTKDQLLAEKLLAETFFALRARPNPGLESVGPAASGPYVVDKGFEGEDDHRRWLVRYGTRLICARPNATPSGHGPSA